MSYVFSEILKKVARKPEVLQFSREMELTKFSFFCFDTKFHTPQYILLLPERIFLSLLQNPITRSLRFHAFTQGQKLN